ncbi:hypothetical protein PHMEG_0007330 [Phytophthora megakarya]|uniref:Polyprotein n=1 Tax=Phytophthora megakarya TaxID=4795 RepID=A0A225WNH5_9STRA|nr:hypothetical protein PHMEG_0007330 [Phytophthora megakarya]
MQLVHLLKSKTFSTLDKLLEASRTLNPRETARSSDKSSKSGKSAPPKPDAKAETVRCTASHCTEQGHTKERCWRLHPELQSKRWKGSGKKTGKGAASASKSSKDTGEKNLWSMLNSIPSDLSKLKVASQGQTQPLAVVKTGSSILYVNDLGMIDIKYANGKTESVKNQTIRLTVFVDSGPGYTTDF